jgi:hypothetical protein
VDANRVETITIPTLNAFPNNYRSQEVTARGDHRIGPIYGEGTGALDVFTVSSRSGLYKTRHHQSRLPEDLDLRAGARNDSLAQLVDDRA